MYLLAGAGSKYSGIAHLEQRWASCRSSSVQAVSQTDKAELMVLTALSREAYAKQDAADRHCAWPEAPKDGIRKRHPSAVPISSAAPEKVFGSRTCDQALRFPPNP